MNRRGFLRLLGLAPIVGPAAVKALGAAPQPFSITAGPFAFEASSTVKRWAATIWIEAHREVYFSTFMKGSQSESIILTFDRPRDLLVP